jgi:ADP-heptose:LPS heptosyltransferase
MPLDLYAATLDLTDIFLSGDTGPMHIAAACKKAQNGHNSLKNATSLATLFGSTDAKIYGYDSYDQRCMKAPQKAPSKIFDSPCPQKNILCTLEKIGHRCRRNDCFKADQADQASQWVNQCLKRRLDGEMDADH